MATTSISLNYVFTLRVNIGVPPYPIGLTPSGEKSYYDIMGGTIKGSNINATIQRGGGDSVLTRSDGWGNLDINYPALTDQGEWIYVRYLGIMQGTEALGKAFSNDPSAKSTKFEDQYMRVTPIFETASERLSWLNQAAFIGKGRLDVTPEGTFVVYEVFKVE